MEFEENNEEFEGKLTRNLKEKHREFFTRANIKAFSKRELRFRDILLDSIKTASFLIKRF